MDSADQAILSLKKLESMMSQSKVQMILSLKNAQEQMPDLVKDATNPHFKSKFVSLEAMLTQITPILRKNGLFIIQPFCECAGGVPGVKTILFHENGESMESICPIPAAKGGAQEQMAASSYARRYSIVGILGLVPVEPDDDGETAEGRGRIQASTVKKAQTFATVESAESLLRRRDAKGLETSDKARKSVMVWTTLDDDQQGKLISYLKTGL